METGISVYPASGGTIKKKRPASGAGPLPQDDAALYVIPHPETDRQPSASEQAVPDTARQCQLDIVADVSPASEACLGMDRFDPEVIAKLGITTVRFDDGFDATKLAMCSHIVRVQVNASMLTRKDLEDLRKNGAQLGPSTACTTSIPVPTRAWPSTISRPRPTGSTPVACPSAPSSPAVPQRAPLYEGLPTLEFHRHQDVSSVGRLSRLGVQSVFIGDDKPGR